MQIKIALKDALIAKQAEPQIQKLAKATEGVEAMFLKDLLGIMRKSVLKTDKPMPGSDIYYDMLDQALSENMAKKGSLGISKMMMETMKPAILQAEAEKFAAAAKAETMKAVQRAKATVNTAVRDLVDEAEKAVGVPIKISTSGR
ncbi:MAG: rod-binding protein [Fimbriimonadaceae bacterium]|nr:rod-binding protein [Fimbriimonadaceae bacterium]